jgi:hypothetical protein
MIKRCIKLLTVAVSLVLTVAASAQDALPRPEAPFQGKIGRTIKDSMSDVP